MFPIEWTRITRARNLERDDFACLPELDFARILVGTDQSAPEYKIAVILDADTSKSTVSVVGELEGAAFTVAGYRFEGAIEFDGKARQHG